MEREYASFIKFGEKQYMEKLLHGEVFCRPIDYFNRIASKDLRGDKNDGAVFIKQIKDLKLKLNEQEIYSSFSGQLYGRNPNLFGNIFCLFGLETRNLELETKAIKKLNINLDGVSFGDTAVWIYDPSEFINRVEKAILQEDLSFELGPIKYYDDKVYEGPLTPFDKSIKYMSQTEVRFWIPNSCISDLKFNIGDINDIAGLLTIDKFDKLEYEPI